MSGFGRTGAWFAVNHWDVVPDLITMAKGLTSAYVQLGAVGMRQGIADQFKDRAFPSGLTYNSHPLACAAALATIAVYEEDGLIERARSMGELMRDLHADLGARHPSVGATRSIGLFGIVELVRDRATRKPMAPFAGSSPEMAALGKFFREQGLYTFVRWNYFFTNPPLCITEAELREGFEIIDRGLEITDRAVVWRLSTQWRRPKSVRQDTSADLSSVTRYGAPKERFEAAAHESAGRPAADRLPLLGAGSPARRRRQADSRAILTGPRQQLQVDPRHPHSSVLRRLGVALAMDRAVSRRSTFRVSRSPTTPPSGGCGPSTKCSCGTFVAGLDEAAVARVTGYRLFNGTAGASPSGRWSSTSSITGPIIEVRS